MAEKKLRWKQNETFLFSLLLFLPVRAMGPVRVCFRLTNPAFESSNHDLVRLGGGRRKEEGRRRRRRTLSVRLPHHQIMFQKYDLMDQIISNHGRRTKRTKLVKTKIVTRMKKPNEIRS